MFRSRGLTVKSSRRIQPVNPDANANANYTVQAPVSCRSRSPGLTAELVGPHPTARGTGASFPPQFVWTCGDLKRDKSASRWWLCVTPPCQSASLLPVLGHKVQQRNARIVCVLVRCVDGRGGGGYRYPFSLLFVLQVLVL